MQARQDGMHPTHVIEVDTVGHSVPCVHCGVCVCVFVVHLSRACAVLRSALRRFATRTALTIHSFIHSVIRSFGHSVIRSLSHSVIQSLSLSVTQSIGHSVIHEPHAARTERARTMWRETLHTRLNSRLLQNVACARLPLPPASFVLSRRAPAVTSGTHGATRAFPLCLLG